MYLHNPSGMHSSLLHAAIKTSCNKKKENIKNTMFGLSTELITKGKLEEIQPLLFQELVLHQSESRHHGLFVFT